MPLAFSSPAFFHEKLSKCRYMQSMRLNVTVISSGKASNTNLWPHKNITLFCAIDSTYGLREFVLKKKKEIRDKHYSISKKVIDRALPIIYAIFASCTGAFCSQQQQLSLLFRFQHNICYPIKTIWNVKSTNLFVIVSFCWCGWHIFCNEQGSLTFHLVRGNYLLWKDSLIWNLW